MKDARSNRNDPGTRFRLSVRQPYLRNALALCLFETAFYFAYRYGMSFSQASASPFWFPDSVLLCALLMSPPGRWWVFILAPLPIRLFAGVSQDIPLWFLLATFANDSGKGLLAAAALRRFLRNPIRFETVREFALYCLFAVLLVPAASAFGGAAARDFLGQGYWSAWEQWFLGNALAQLVVTPFIFYWVLGSPWNALARFATRWFEGALLTAGLIVTAYIAFNIEAGGTGFTGPRFYAPVPFLFWAAVRFGMFGASGAIAVIAFFSVAAALQGHGPFSGHSPADTALALQHFLSLRAAPLYLVAVLIEQRTGIENSLRESEERFRNVANTAPALIWMSGPDKLCEFFNQGWLDFTGGTLKQELGNGWTEAVHGEDIQRCLETYHSSFDARLRFEMEYRLRRNDGKYRWILTRGVPRYAPDGTFVGYIGSAIDLTDRKRAEEALQHSEARLNLAMEAAGFGYWEVEVSSGKVTRSESLERMFVLRPGSMANTQDAYFALVHPEDQEIPRRHLERCIETLESEDIEYRIIRSDGAVRWIYSRGQAILGPDGRAARVLGMSADISERKRMEHALQEALAEVQRLKDRLEAENVYLRSEVSAGQRHGDLVGESEAIRGVLRQVEQVAATDVTVLILGETGTGKELVARAVHAHSTRRDRPLVKVNCSALPAELIESELFGHEKGAFTGAMARQVGRFELADGGTIFLDEVGDLPLGLQAKLLRVLQEGEFERLGSGKTIGVDVRVIAATNRDLEQALHNETFRSDLYYRLNVYPIHLPPLRERKQDIELLAQTFLTEASQRLGRVFGAIPESMLAAFQRYDWPGNVRELQNVIERAAVTSTAPVLQLPQGWNLPAAPVESSGPVVLFEREVIPVHETASQECTLEEFERGHIVQVLEQTGWRVEGPRGAAFVLGLNPSTLRSRMQKLGIMRPGRQ